MKKNSKTTTPGSYNTGMKTTSSNPSYANLLTTHLTTLSLCRTVIRIV
jgi:hypothetical protein